MSGRAGLMNCSSSLGWLGCLAWCGGGTLAAPTAADAPAGLQRRLGPQHSERDTEGPILSLGKPGRFDSPRIQADLGNRVT
jgi:hypothetical protein